MCIDNERLKNVGNHTAVKAEAGSSCGSSGKKQRNEKRKYVNGISRREREACLQQGGDWQEARGRLRKHWTDFLLKHGCSIFQLKMYVS